jgi:hypothetical protein
LITREALRVLEGNLILGRRVNREYSDKFGVDGAKIGDTVNARVPPRYIVSEGQALDLQDATETRVPIQLNHQYHVDLQFSSADLLLSIDDFSDRFIKPAIAALANKIDWLVASQYYKFNNFVGTPGVTPNALLTYLQGKANLDRELCPNDGERSTVLTPDMEITIVDALKGLFQQSSAIAEQYATGAMGRAIGFEWFMDQNMVTHTIGAWAGAGQVNGANQTGSSLITDTWTASVSTLKVGDIFTIGSGATAVNGINPQSRISTGKLRNFVVTADVTSDGSGNATISIYPPIYAAGQYQTVDALPADNAVLAIFGAASTQTPQGLQFHRDAITLVSADLPLPRGVDMAAVVSDPQLGISMRLARQWDINTDNFPCRVDVLVGAAVVRPELGNRVCG